MENKAAEKIIRSMIGQTDITINGNKPWDIKIHHPNFYSRVIEQGSLGLGEAYMDKWWDCERLDFLFDRFLSANLDAKINIPWPHKMRALLAKFINYQTRRRSKEVAIKHYDLGNELFTAMLDSRMNYSCGYFKNAKTLDEAQLDKLELICQKLKLEPGMRLLDIGCGWGALAKYAAEKYKVSVVGITISKEQVEYAQQNCKDLPVTIRLQDYRDIKETFDRVVSIGMFEHVGHLNYLHFMQLVHRALVKDGIFVLHTIGGNQTLLFANEWIVKYIFPNGMLPSITQIGKTAEGLFVMEDWHNFSAYYDNTLMAWYENFCKHWPRLKNKYDERFYRMWSYYLLSCAGGFRARSIQLWQIVFSKSGVRGGYMAPR